MMALNPPALPTVFFSIWLAINLFRYFSYLALRVSWVDPRTSISNPLNQNLAYATKEMGRFLQGLIASNRALGVSALANSLAHQLSQPITGIIFQTASVKRDLIDQGNQQKSVLALNSISNQLENLSELVSNLRRLFNNKESAFTSFHLQSVCDDMLEIIGPTLKSNKINLLKNYESDPLVYGNAIHIQQVLINLFNNAIDAIKSANGPLRQINLRLLQDNTVAIITIQDTGGGISSEVMLNMFELFQTTKVEGLGIGLWLSKTILDAHEGTITACNCTDNGAIFEIRLPLATIFN